MRIPAPTPTLRRWLGMTEENRQPQRLSYLHVIARPVRRLVVAIRFSFDMVLIETRLVGAICDRPPDQHHVGVDPSAFGSALIRPRREARCERANEVRPYDGAITHPVGAGALDGPWGMAPHCALLERPTSPKALFLTCQRLFDIMTGACSFQESGPI